MLTCPFSSSWLFVNFNLSNDTICFIHVLPGAGESGCTWIRGGEIGSALPATTQLELKLCARTEMYQWLIDHKKKKLSQTCETNNGNVCHRPEQSPSSLCTSIADPNHWSALETLETCVDPFLWQSFRCLVHGIYPTMVSFRVEHSLALMPDGNWLALLLDRFPLYFVGLDLYFHPILSHSH